MAGPDGDRRGSALETLTAFTLAAGCAVGAYYYWRAQRPVEAFSNAGFDVSRVDRPQQAAYAAPKQPAASPAPVTGGDLPLSFGAAKPASNPKFVKGGVSPDRAQAEREWLAKNGAALRQYQRKLDAITARYQQRSKVVRDVDRAFGAMPRYMAVRRRYEQDRDPFAFARDAVALPEVRAQIRQRMADPEVWKVSVGMILEALKDPPPPAIYKEAQSFMTQDPAMAGFVPEFSSAFSQNMSAAVQGIPPGTDLSPINKVLSDVSPAAAPAASR